MNKILLTIHLVTAIIAIGPITLATSIFPKYLNPKNENTLQLLNRITKIYSYIAVITPISGLILAIKKSKMDALWINASLILSIVAALIIIALILPAQNRQIKQKTIKNSQITQLRIYNATFAITWVIIILFMAYKPA